MTSDPDNCDADIDRVCSTLERIAATFPDDSDEACAIADAASAFIIVRQRQSLATAWRQLRDARNGDVPPEILERMRAMGIDTDDLDDFPSP
jgi:transcriptional regulator of met regulon